MKPHNKIEKNYSKQPKETQIEFQNNWLQKFLT